MVAIKKLATKLGEQTAPHDISPQELCDTFEQIANLAKQGCHWVRFVNQNKFSNLEAQRYQWLRSEFLAGRHHDIAEGLNTAKELDDYIDRKLKDELFSR